VVRSEGALEGRGGVAPLDGYRKAQINDRGREVARLHKALEDTAIKLGTVATNIMGKSAVPLRSSRLLRRRQNRTADPVTRPC